MTVNNIESKPFVKKSLEIMDNMMNTKKRVNISDSEIEINGKKFVFSTFNKRLFASTIDILLVAILVAPINYIFSQLGMDDSIIKLQMQPELMLQDITMVTFLKMLYKSGLITYMLLMQLIIIFFTGLYVVYFWYKKGATPGKMLLRCKVLDAKTGEGISIKQGIIRFLSIPLSILPLLIGLFMIDFTKKRQALHDKIAGTIVVSSKNI
jgi:uncharacterized RDD family membrane protein YckC